LPEIPTFKKFGDKSKPEEAKKPAFGGGKFGMQMRKQGGLTALSNAIGETENVKPDIDEVIESP
jgi:hypothetical protein